MLVVGYVLWGWVLFGLLVTAPLWVPAVVVGVVWVRRERARQRAVDAALDEVDRRRGVDGLDRSPEASATSVRLPGRERPAG